MSVFWIFFYINYCMPERKEDTVVWHSSMWRRLYFLLPCQTGSSGSWTDRQCVIAAQKVLGSRQPPRQDSYCLKGRIVRISNHYIKLSYSSLCTVHRLTGRLSCPPAQFLEYQKPFSLCYIYYSVHIHTVASKHIPVMIYKRNYKIAQEMSAT